MISNMTFKIFIVPKTPKQHPKQNHEKLTKMYIILYKIYNIIVLNEMSISYCILYIHFIIWDVFILLYQIHILCYILLYCANICILY